MFKPSFLFNLCFSNVPLILYAAFSLSLDSKHFLIAPVILYLTCDYYLISRYLEFS